MRQTTIILAAACTLIGLALGLTIPKADARTDYWLSGTGHDSATSSGYVFQTDATDTKGTRACM